MKLFVLMSTRSPWSQSVATSLAELGHIIHVVDIGQGSQGSGGEATVSGREVDFRAFSATVEKIHWLPSPFGGYWRYLWTAPKLRRLARRLNPDAVLTLYGGGFGLMAFLSGIRPYYIYVVGSDVLLASAPKRWLNKRTFRAAAKVFANGQHLAAAAQQQSPHAAVLELLIGVDPSRFVPADFSRRPVQMICTRGFQAVYNSDAILRALARFPEGLPDYRVRFTSAGSKYEEVCLMADKLLPPNTRAKVSLSQGGSYPEILRALSESHIYLSMSRSDGTATSLLEAMGTGLYPVVSDIPANREWISDTRLNGRLVPLDDDDALCQALTECIGQVDRLASYMEENQQLVRFRANAQINRSKLSAEINTAKNRQ